MGVDIFKKILYNSSMMVQKILSKFKLIFIPCKENRYRPKVLDTKFLLYYLIFLFTLKILIIPFIIYFPKSIFFAEITNNAIIEFTNQERQLTGLSFLKENPVLDQNGLFESPRYKKKVILPIKAPKGFLLGIGLKKLATIINLPEKI